MEFVLPLAAALGCLIALGCNRPTWMTPAEPCVFQPGVSKEQIFAHLNQNITGGPGTPGLRSWWCNSARLHVSGVGMPIPPMSAMVAVEQPRNFRMTVANPLGGREVDIGSNHKEFWVWTKDASEVAVVNHEDLSLALTQMPMPVHIHPDWLMEVFGVIPFDPDEFTEVKSNNPQASNAVMELVALRDSPLGEPMERVLRVNVCRGRVTEHSLRRPGGPVIARAIVDRYVGTPGSPAVPTMIRLEWPETGIAMTMNLTPTEVNPPGLAANAALFAIPAMNGVDVVNLGDVARYHQRNGVMPAAGPGTAAAEISSSLHSVPADNSAPAWQGATSGSATLELPVEDAKPADTTPTIQEETDNPFEKYRPTTSVKRDGFRSTQLQITDAPLWTPTASKATVSTATVNGAAAAAPPSAYSATAWRSSSDRPRPAPE